MGGSVAPSEVSGHVLFVIRREKEEPTTSHLLRPRAELPKDAPRWCGASSIQPLQHVGEHPEQLVDLGFE
jgi:hypothetical protein